MSPIEKVRARAEAIEALGVSRFAKPEEIRAAWRKAALQSHPDQNSGNQDAFTRARAAYEYLSSTEHDSEHWIGVSHLEVDREPESAGPSVRRPMVATRTSGIAREVEAECRALLGTKAGGESPEAAPLPASDHIPSSVEVRGRRLTYRIETPLVKGVNRVALPTALLVGSKSLKPDVVAFTAARAGAGEIVIPEAVRTRVFPGARAVRIRFAMTGGHSAQDSIDV